MDLAKIKRSMVKNLDWHIAEVERLKNVIRDLRQKLALAGVEGSPPPWETTIGRLRTENQRLHENGRYVS